MFTDFEDDDRETQYKVLLARMLVDSNDFSLLAQRTITKKTLERMSHLLGSLIETSDKLEEEYSEFLTPEIISGYEEVIFVNSNLMESIRERLRSH